MQFGSSTVPLPPLVAVVGAGALVLLILWGVWRARRHPTPAPLPVSHPDGRTEQPCAADWTGEAAGGPADPPRPPRARTVADAVAERYAGTGPLRESAEGESAEGESAGAESADAGAAVAATSAAPRRPGRHAAPEDRIAREHLSTPDDERPDPVTPARPGPPPARTGRTVPGDAVERSAAAAAAGTSGTGEGPGGAGTERDTTAPPPGEETAVHPARPDAPGTGDDLAMPLPPWSAERTVPPTRGLPSGDPVDTPTADGDGGPYAGSPEPVSRAVQQALAARAVQRARARHPDPDLDPAPDAGEPAGGGEQQELPLSVLPSRPPAPVTGAEARDRLLSVLIADPARAVDATIRLDDSRGAIDELGDVLRRRRAELAGAVQHLRDCGLDPAQIGRLSGMDVDDVRTILDGEDAR